jgi:hypothetical protein
VVSFLQASPPQPCMYFSPLPLRATSPAHRIPLDFITLTIFGQQYQSCNSSLCSFSHYQVQRTSAASYSGIPSACALNFNAVVLKMWVAILSRVASNLHTLACFYRTWSQAGRSARTFEYCPEGESVFHLLPLI